MKITLAAKVAVIAAVLLGLVEGSESADKKATLNLHVVVRLESGVARPIADAKVIVSQQGKRVRDDKSGQDGRSAVPLPAGSYSVTVTKPGFQTGTVIVDIAAQDVNKDVFLTQAPTRNANPTK